MHKRLLGLMMAIGMFMPLMAQRAELKKFDMIDAWSGKPFVLRSDQEVRVLHSPRHDPSWKECSARLEGRILELDDVDLRVSYTRMETSCLLGDTVMTLTWPPAGAPASTAVIPIGDVRSIIKDRWGHKAASIIMAAGLSTALVFAPVVAYGGAGNSHAFNADSYRTTLGAGLIITCVSLPFYLAIPSQRELRPR